MILTVDHIIPDKSSKHESTIITHPSEQESQYNDHWNRVKSYFAVLRSCCQSCRTLLAEHSENSDFYKPVKIPDFDTVCSTAQRFSKAKETFIRNFPARSLGPLIARSELRSAVNITSDGKYSVEMDWALFAIEQWSEPLELHAQEVSNGMSFLKVVPGAPVSATGRTSGHQTGVINTVMSIVRHDSRFTREWSVYKDDKFTLQEWIEGGIGVDGDSGSWIIGAGSVIYGMVWARDRPNTNPITLFTPIEEIIADIKRKAGARHISLPIEAESNLPREKGEQKGDVSNLKHNEGHSVLVENRGQARSKSVDGICRIPDEMNQDRIDRSQKQESSDLVGLVSSLRISEAKSTSAREIEVSAGYSSTRH